VKKIKTLYNVVLPLLIGAVIYYLFFPNVLFVIRIDSILGFGFHLPISSVKNNFILLVTRCFMLDMLWAYAFTWLSYLILEKYKVAITISAIFCILIEVIQIFSFVPGTFDVLDIIFEIVAVLLAAILIGKNIGGKSNEKSNSTNLMHPNV